MIQYIYIYSISISSNSRIFSLYLYLVIARNVDVHPIKDFYFGLKSDRSRRKIGISITLVFHSASNTVSYINLSILVKIACIAILSRRPSSVENVERRTRYLSGVYTPTNPVVGLSSLRRINFFSFSSFFFYCSTYYSFSFPTPHCLYLS